MNTKRNLQNPGRSGVKSLQRRSLGGVRHHHLIHIYSGKGIRHTPYIFPEKDQQFPTKKKFRNPSNH